MAGSLAWQNFTSEDKENCRKLRATFVMAPRDMSRMRIFEIVKETLSKRNVIFGIAEEEYVQGFEGQAQFKTLPLKPITELAEVIAKTKGALKKLQVLTYPQASVDDVIRALRPNNAVVVRGSYQYPFHRSSTCALLEKRGIPFEYVSPFTDEREAQQYLSDYTNEHPAVTLPSLPVTGKKAFELVSRVATESFDYSFQTGAVLAERVGSKYHTLVAACNEVVPYQTYALHYGNAREVHRAGHQSDAAHYDTIHAEMNILVKSVQQGLDLQGKSLFINMMPCPNCARTLCKTGLKEVLYQQVHSDGYAEALFEKAGITARKVDL